MSSEIRQTMQEAMERPPSRYLVGIDLGTTNCAAAYVDTQDPGRQVQIFRIEQLVDWGLMEARDTLPSFHYQLSAMETESAQHRWVQRPTGSQENLAASPYVVGILARDRGLQLPGRQIASAKSWLCHAGVDRTASFLPWHADEDVARYSPIEASASYLYHLRQAWDQAHRSDPLAEQEVVITLPASFDEVARELTIEAAKRAGLPRILLIEEPQAAFYCWLQRHGTDWWKTIHAGQTVLICDIGGGTTDFTLIRVKEEESSGSTEEREQKTKLHRVAVGQHLILGGDNLDLALAKTAEQALVEAEGGALSARDWDALRLHCRVAKETLLGPNPPSQFVIHLAGAGTRLIAQQRTVTLDAGWMEEVLLEGFFPRCDLRDRPVEESVGLQEFGLPYAADPAVTRHLAAFLWEHRWAGRERGDLGMSASWSSGEELERRAARPDFILFNGGVLEATRIRQRLVEQIEAWFPKGETSGADGWKLQVLEGNRLDLAVAQGAAYYGLVRRGEGVPIDASLARAYALVIEEAPRRAMCLVPGDAAAGDQWVLDSYPLRLAVGQPVQFPLFVSSTQLTARPGEIVELEEEHWRPMNPIRTVLELPKSRRTDSVSVVLEIQLTEIGTLQLACRTVDGSHRWKLDFDVRSAVETDRVGHAGIGEAAGIVDEGKIEACLAEIDATFGEKPTVSPAQLMKRLNEVTATSRHEWPPSLLRAMWGRLMELDLGRKHSGQHEARWLNLVGYCLRPGYGFAADDWRVATTWRKVQGKLFFKQGTSPSEAVILWRRVSGGFTAGQQRALYQDCLPRLRGLLVAEAKSVAVPIGQEAIELLRLVGSLELLPASERSQLAKWILGGLSRKKLAPLLPAMAWTLGRLGARVPMYGPANQILQISQIESWLEELLASPIGPSDMAFTLVQWTRRTGDRYRDVGASCRQRVLEWMESQAISGNLQRYVAEICETDRDQQSLIAGEALPLGLQLGSH